MALPLQAVCFDVGGTLIDRKGPGPMARVAAVLSMERDAINALLRDVLLRTPLTPDEAAWRLADRLGRNAEADRRAICEALARPGGQSRPGPGALAALAGCRARGLAIAVLSNCTSFDGVDVEALLGPFSAVVESWRTGVCKPERAAFALVEARLGVPPDALVHVGDDPLADVAGAHSAGWRSIFVGPSEVAGPADQVIESLADLVPALDVLAEVAR